MEELDFRSLLDRFSKDRFQRGEHVDWIDAENWGVTGKPLQDKES